MRRLVFFTIFIAGCISALAQADSMYVWNKWCARKDTMLLFAEGNNVIEIYSRGFKPADIKLKCLDNSLRIGKPEIKGDTLSVLAMPYPDKGSKMRLAIQNKKTSKTIKTIDFYCDNIPTPVACVGKILTDAAKKKDILSQTILKAYFPKSLYSYPYSIKQYTFKVSTSKGGATIPVHGFFLTNDVLKEINAAPEGTIVSFTDIKATCPECATRTLGDINLRIK